MCILHTRFSKSLPHNTMTNGRWSVFYLIDKLLVIIYNNKESEVLFWHKKIIQLPKLAKGI